MHVSIIAKRSKTCQWNQFQLHFNHCFGRIVKGREGGFYMKAIHSKDDQVKYLKERLEMFMEVLDSIEPETTELEDIDRLIEMIDELENKVEQFNKRGTL